MNGGQEFIRSTTPKHAGCTEGAGGGGGGGNNVRIYVVRLYWNDSILIKCLFDVNTRHRIPSRNPPIRDDKHDEKMSRCLFSVYDR